MNTAVGTIAVSRKSSALKFNIVYNSKYAWLLPAKDMAFAGKGG